MSPLSAPQDRVEQPSPYDRWYHDITTQEEGEAHFIYRLPRTAESLSELEEWMVLVLAKIRRRVESAPLKQRMIPQDSKDSSSSLLGLPEQKGTV